MEHLRLIHAADFHLDAPFRGGRPGYGPIRRQDVRRAFSATIGLALSMKADLLLLCGDLYEQDFVTLDTLSFVRRELERLHDIPILLLAGNHDPLTSESWYRTLEWPSHVRMLDSRAGCAAGVWLPELDVFAAGFGFSSRRQESPDFSTLPPPRQGCFNLLLIHGTLDTPFDGVPYNPVTLQQVSGSGYHYAAMGHYHKPFEKPGLPWIANPGSPEPLGFDELGEHGVLLTDLVRKDGSVSVSTRQVPLSARVYVQRSLDVTALDGPDAMRSALSDCLRDCSPERHLPHVRLTGSPAEPPDMRSLAVWADGVWLLSRLTDDTRPPVEWMSALSDDSVTGIFLRKLALMIAAAEASGDGERLEILRRARRTGLEALAYGTVQMPPEQ
jgi:DNA repair protein SbcD/Mre11